MKRIGSTVPHGLQGNPCRLDVLNADGRHTISCVRSAAVMHFPSRPHFQHRVRLSAGADTKNMFCINAFPILQ